MVLIAVIYQPVAEADVEPIEAIDGNTKKMRDKTATHFPNYYLVVF